MGNINDKVKELHPHVLSIRFTNGLTVVDCAFNNGWEVPKSDVVGFETTADKPNYYMLYPLNENVGIDEMLDYVTYIIKVNVEREQKVALLQVKFNELKTLFAKNSLEKCKTLEFSFKDSTVPSNVEVSEIPILPNEEINDSVVLGYGEHAPTITQDKQDGDVPPVREITSQEVVNDRDVNNVDPQTATFNNETFDLPPKDDKIVVEEFEAPRVICKCDPNDPNQVCPACI